MSHSYDKGRTDFKLTIGIPCFALVGELWGVYCGILEIIDFISMLTKINVNIKRKVPMKKFVSTQPYTA